MASSKFIAPDKTNLLVVGTRPQLALWVKVERLFRLRGFPDFRGPNVGTRDFPDRNVGAGFEVELIHPVSGATRRAITEDDGIAAVHMRGVPDDTGYRLRVTPPSDQDGGRQAGPDLPVGSARVLYRKLTCRVDVNGTRLVTRSPPAIEGGAVHGDFFHTGKASDNTTGLRVLVDLKPDFMRAPPFRVPGDPVSKQTFIVLHRTDGSAQVANQPTIGNTLDFFLHDGALAPRTDRASAHYVVDVDGHVVMLIPEGRLSGHLGSGRMWHGFDVQKASVAFEIVNRPNTVYSEAQKSVVLEIVEEIRRKWNIQRRNVIGHGDVQADRAAGDPGPEFFWRRLEDAGQAILTSPSKVALPSDIDDTMFDGFFAGSPTRTMRNGQPPDPRTGPQPVRRLQENLATFGYDLSANGTFDGHTIDFLGRFQRRAFASDTPRTTLPQLGVLNLDTGRALQAALVDIASGSP